MAMYMGYFIPVHTMAQGKCVGMWKLSSDTFLSSNMSVRGNLLIRVEEASGRTSNGGQFVWEHSSDESALLEAFVKGYDMFQMMKEIPLTDLFFDLKYRFLSSRDPRWSAECQGLQYNNVIATLPRGAYDHRHLMTNLHAGLLEQGAFDWGNNHMEGES